jgi:hypothetical protein
MCMGEEDGARQFWSAHVCAEEKNVWCKEKKSGAREREKENSGAKVRRAAGVAGLVKSSSEPQ